MPETLTIETAGTDQLMYSFIVDGDVSPTDAGGGVSAVGELESQGGNVTIQQRSDGTVQVDGKTGGDFGDAYTIDGTLLSFTGNLANSRMNLALGNQQFQPANLPLETGGGQQPPTDGNDGDTPDDGQDGQNGQNGQNGQRQAGFSVDATTALAGVAAFAIVWTVAGDD